MLVLSSYVHFGDRDATRVDTTVLVPMVLLRKRHPVSIVLLALFTVSMSLAVGLGCLSRKGDSPLDTRKTSAFLHVTLLDLKFAKFLVHCCAF